MASLVYLKSNGRDIAVNMDMVRTIQPVENKPEKPQCTFSMIPDNSNHMGALSIDGTYEEVLRTIENASRGSQSIPGAAPPTVRVLG